MIIFCLYTISRNDYISISFQLQGGGDMSALKHFNTGAIRQGFIIDEVIDIHSFDLLFMKGHHDLIMIRGRDTCI